jgi:peptidoglycan L-alanyl-D-glutamate endopeptidase CwlK
MPNFGAKSKSKLETAHSQLQRLFNEVIKHYDCTVVYGHRTPKEQFDLYKQGRELQKDGSWKKVGQTVTDKDGLINISKHNHSPSKAVDVAPYINGEVSWDEKECLYFAGIVKGTALQMGINIRWGGDWDGDNQVRDNKFNDLVHFEVK